MTRLITLLAMATLLVGAPARAESTAYFLGGETELLQLRIEDLSVEALWKLDWTKGLGDRFPPRSEGRPYVGGVAFSPDGQDVYLVVPTSIPERVEEPTGFRILYVKLPRWDKVEAEYTVPVRTVSSPYITLGPDGREVYVQYEFPRQGDSTSDGKFVDEIRVLSGEDLHEVRSYRAQAPMNSLKLAPGRAYPFFTADTYFPPNSDDAYDKGRLISFSDGTYQGRRIDFNAFLSADQEGRLVKRYGTNQKTQRSRGYFIPVDAVGRWVLLLAQGTPQDGSSTDLRVVVDLSARKALHFIETPPASADLLPDGRLLVRPLRPPKDGTEQRDRAHWQATGEAWIFDPATGDRVATFSADLLAGEAEGISFICADPTVEHLFFTSPHGLSRRLAVLTLTTGRAQRLAVDFWPAANTPCIFLDEDSR